MCGMWKGGKAQRVSGGKAGWERGCGRQLQRGLGEFPGVRPLCRADAASPGLILSAAWQGLKPKPRAAHPAQSGPWGSVAHAVPVKAHSLHGILFCPLPACRPCPSGGLVTDPKRRKDSIRATRPRDTASRPTDPARAKVLFPAPLRTRLARQARMHACTHSPVQRFATPWTSSAGQIVAYSLGQRIFPMQASNSGLLHCRRILYQLSYQGSPEHRQAKFKAMPPGDARLAGLGLILLPPAGHHPSPAPRPSKGPVPA